MNNNKLNPCPGRAEAIYLWLDGELPALEQTEFQTHLAGCPACQRLLAELQTLLAQVDSLAEVAAPAELADQVMARLPQPQTTAPGQTLSQWVLLGQIVAGLSLVVITLPQVVPLIQGQLAWLSWSTWANILAMETGAWAELIWQVGLWLQNQPAQLTSLTASFQLSGGPALLVVAGLVIAWLVGNTLLLKSSPRTFKHRGI
jgi:anti-sigma factor RsiW